MENQGPDAGILFPLGIRRRCETSSAAASKRHCFFTSRGAFEWSSGRNTVRVITGCQDHLEASCTFRGPLGLFGFGGRRQINDMALTRSGLQKDVLSLYRRALRMVRTKPPLTQPKFLLVLRYTFHANASAISPRNVSAIEHLLRKGTRQIEMYEDDAVKDVWVSSEMLQWQDRWKTREGASPQATLIERLSDGGLGN